MNEKENKDNLELKRMMGSLNEVLGREKSRKIEKTEELTLAEMKLEALRKKMKEKKEILIVAEEKEKEKEKQELMFFKNRDMEVMTVEDSELYFFDEDRVERSLKKGQIWAIYDDDDGMPRHYGLIDDVVSWNPFEIVKELWALYNEKGLDMEGNDSLSKDKQCYDIFVLLTSYSEMLGLSLAYLEKVDRFRAVFKRREVGCHAIRWLDKDDFRLFSHHIPARKLSGDEVPSSFSYCWELDPASLPSHLLTIS